MLILCVFSGAVGGGGIIAVIIDVLDAYGAPVLISSNTINNNNDSK